MPTLSAGKISVDKNKSAVGRTVTEKSVVKRFFFNGFAGYTLLELLVVLIIIGLVSAMVAPKLVGSLHSLNIQTTAKRLASSLRYAREQAVSEKTTCVALLDINNHRLLIFFNQDELDERSSDYSGEEGVSKARLVYDLPTDITVEKIESFSGEAESDPFRIYFFPNGSSTGGKITLRNERQKQFQITVDFITASVTINDA